jgi:hypothetical protein
MAVQTVENKDESNLDDIMFRYELVHKREAVSVVVKAPIN